MRDVAREEILANIRSALAGESSSHRPATETAYRAAGALSDAPPDRALLEKREDLDRLVERFKAEFVRIGGKLYHATDASNLQQVINEILANLGASKIVAWSRTDGEITDLLDSFDGTGIVVHREGKGIDQELFVREAATADVGITSVDYALADTATLVLMSAEGRPRCVSLLPPVHLAILPSGRILPGLDEFFRVLGQETEPVGQQLSSAVTFITGPSRTADIELTLVVGVHGPQQLHVVLLDDEKDYL